MLGVRFSVSARRHAAPTRIPRRICRFRPLFTVSSIIATNKATAMLLFSAKWLYHHFRSSLVGALDKRNIILDYSMGRARRRLGFSILPAAATPRRAMRAARMMRRRSLSRRAPHITRMPMPYTFRLTMLHRCRRLIRPFRRRRAGAATHDTAEGGEVNNAGFADADCRASFGAP